MDDVSPSSRVMTLRVSTVAYIAPLESSDCAGVLPAGTVVVVTKVEGGWFELSDGRFIPAAAATKAAPKPATGRRPKAKLGVAFWTAASLGAGLLVWLAYSLSNPDPYADAESICTGTAIKRAVDAQAGVDVEWEMFEEIRPSTFRADGSIKYRAHDNSFKFYTFTCEATDTKDGYYGVNLYPK